MNRLQKKCFVASAGLHLLLICILFIGPAFIAKDDKPLNLPLLDFIPLKLVDDAVSGGGNPNANSAPAAQPRPQPPAQQQQQPQPEPQPPAPKPEPVKPVEPQHHEPDPVKPVIKTKDIDPDSLEVTTTKKPRTPEINLKPVTRNNKDKQREKEKAAAEQRAREEAENRRREQQLADNRRRVAAAFGNVADVIGNGLSSGTSVELRGPGGGGVPYANWLQTLQTIYTHAWNPPDGATSDSDTVEAEVTIARDGHVVKSRITRSSGNARVDRSVRATLDKVERTLNLPLPDTAKEDERTVSIEFNVKARKAIG